MFLMNRNFDNFGKLVSKTLYISRPVNCYSFKDVEMDDSDRNFVSKLREYTRIMNSSKDRN